nr:hypothetical protein [Myxacorys almedinensis]
MRNESAIAEIIQPASAIALHKTSEMRAHKPSSDRPLSAIAPFIPTFARPGRPQRSLTRFHHIGRSRGLVGSD